MSGPGLEVQGSVAIIGRRRVVQISTMVIPGPPMVIQPDLQDAYGNPVGKGDPLAVASQSTAIIVALCEDGTLWMIPFGSEKAQWKEFNGPPSEQAQFQGDPRGP